MDNFKLAIIIDAFSGGGVSKVLSDFLKEIQSQGWDITLFVRDFDKIWKENLPNKINCKPWNGKKTFKETKKNEGFISVLKLLKNLCMVKLCRWNYGRKMFYLARCNKELDGNYDCVIGYHMIVNDVTIMTLEKINANRRILWVHGQKTIREKDSNFYSNIYSRADSIVCVSHGTEQQWKIKIPKCKNKITTIHNFYDIEMIYRKANESLDEFKKNDDEIVIVSIGRVSEEKGFDRVPEVTQKLVEDGYNIKWYIVGSGDRLHSINLDIKDRNLENHVYMLGYKDNPYPYVKYCDIYVQPSYTEGFCTSTMEAKILKKPVVTTNVPGMNEQFDNKVDGLIVESSVDGLYNGIKELIESKELLNRILENLSKESITNDEEVNKALKIIRG